MKQDAKASSEDRCKEQVPGSGWYRDKCSNRAKKDGYCGVHHPDAVKARRDKRNKAYDEETARRQKVVADRNAAITQACFEIHRAWNCEWSSENGNCVLLVSKYQQLCAEQYTGCPLHPKDGDA